MSEYDEINKIHNEMIDVLNRTKWTIEIPNHPTKLQRFISRYLFKQEFRQVIKDKS